MLVPIRIPICNIIPLSTPAYFLYFCGHTSKDYINAPSINYKIKNYL
jgi:hypothetical protein